MKLNFLRRLRKRANRDSGFSFAEVVCLLATATIIVTIAVPNLSLVSSSMRANDLMVQLHHDWTKAHKYVKLETCRGILSVHEGGYSFGCDYIGFDNSDIPKPDVTLFSRTMPPDVTILGPKSIVIYEDGSVVSSEGSYETLVQIIDQNSEEDSHSFALLEKGELTPLS